jgi:DNA repair photolyase
MLLPENKPVPIRSRMNGKPVHSVEAKTILNLHSGFLEKLLCDGPTFSAGDLCAYSCAFCYVPAIAGRFDRVREVGDRLQDIVVRRQRPADILRSQLVHPNGKLKFPDPNDRRVVFASPLVDVAANMELVNETIELCTLILTLTHWQIRLLSKSNLLPKIAVGLERYRDRVIYGVSTGTLDNKLAQAFEIGTPLVSKRIDSLLWLQNEKFRTFGMICPSLPMADSAAYDAFARECAEAIRADRCEHVWAEVINVRGESMTRTVTALKKAGFQNEAAWVTEVSGDAQKWENYNRATFLAHANVYRNYPGKLRFLTYPTKSTTSWWQGQISLGAVLLGAHAPSSG